MAERCNARLIVAGPGLAVERFRRTANVGLSTHGSKSRLKTARAWRIFRGDILVGEAQEIFSEKAARIGPDVFAKKYVFRASSDDGQEHFRLISQFYPDLSFVYIYGWDGWNEFSYGSYFIRRGAMRSYRVPVRLISRTLAKYGADDNPNDEWPYGPEIDAEHELMDLAETRRTKWLMNQK